MQIIIIILWIYCLHILLSLFFQLEKTSGNTNSNFMNFKNFMKIYFNTLFCFHNFKKKKWWTRVNWDYTTRVHEKQCKKCWYQIFY